MKRLLLLALSLTMPLLWSCKSDKAYDLSDNTNASTEQSTRNQIDLLHRKSIVPGRVIVKVHEDALENMHVNPVGAMSMSSVSTPLQKTLRSLDVTSMHRLFPPAGKYEARTRAEGLHRWMVINMDESTDVAQAVSMLAKHSEFEYVEPDYRIEHPPVTMIPAYNLRAGGFDERPEGTHFNDPMLVRQWHYYNRGTNSTSIAGADINLYKAWEQEVGKPNVLVCVVDGGIDYTHEDLSNNVDREKSYNFVYKSGGFIGDSIYADFAGHGTHVAGTVAAVNNNNIGVCGVAGGNGSPDSGIRMISSQIFGGSTESGSGASGIKHGADVGAVISQNSWGYRYPGPADLPQQDKEAIDYFIKYAGVDENGEQRPDSPMKGGIVIFAAGNDNKDYDAWPSAYKAVISVSAMAWDFTKASYTNRGNWVSIMAPGGDQDRYGDIAGVLSTVPKTVSSSGYAFFQGTSMACPHVSGIAALIVSKFGKKGFTNTELEKRLLTSLRPYDINYYNPGYEGRLGVGYIDAAVALEDNLNKIPETPKTLELTPDFVSFTCTWSISADADAAHGIAAYYNFYMSDQEITASNYTSMPKVEIRSNGQGIGGKVKYQVRKLQDDKTYYVAVEAVDRWGNKSVPIIKSVKTKFNSAPEIVGDLLKEEMLLLSIKSINVTVPVEEKDGHSWTYTLEGDTKGVKVRRKKDSNDLDISIQPTQQPGQYTFNIVLTDELGKSAKVPVKYRLVKYEQPRLIADFANIIIGKNDAPLSISLADKFSILEGVPVTFSAKSEDESIATVSVDNKGVLSLKGEGRGLVNIKVEVSDPISKVSTSFSVRVVENSNASVYVVYPLPVKDNLKALVNMNIQKVTFVVTSMRGVEVFRKSVTPDDDHIAKVDLRKLAPGTYNLSIQSNKDTYKRTFVKQ